MPLYFLPATQVENNSPDGTSKLLFGQLRSFHTSFLPCDHSVWLASARVSLRSLQSPFYSTMDHSRRPWLSLELIQMAIKFITEHRDLKHIHPQTKPCLETSLSTAGYFSTWSTRWCFLQLKSKQSSLFRSYSRNRILQTVLEHCIR